MLPQIFRRSKTYIAENTELRRYMDLPKFLDLIVNKELYLRRIDGFSDRLEGAIPGGIRKLIDRSFENGHHQESANELQIRARTQYYASCWTLNSRDNIAMWQMYGGSLSKAISVTTTVSELCAVIEPEGGYSMITEVEYPDSEPTDSVMIQEAYDLLRYKNVAYKFEEEIRLIHKPITPSLSPNPDGIAVAIGNMASFLKAITLAPEADPRYRATIESICKNFGLDNILVTSSHSEATL